MQHIDIDSICFYEKSYLGGWLKFFFWKVKKYNMKMAQLQNIISSHFLQNTFFQIGSVFCPNSHHSFTSCIIIISSMSIGFTISKCPHEFVSICKIGDRKSILSIYWLLSFVNFPKYHKKYQLFLFSSKF